MKRVHSIEVSFGTCSATAILTRSTQLTTLYWYTMSSQVRDKQSMKSFRNCLIYLEVVVYFELDNLQPDLLIFQLIQIYYNSSSISSGTCNFSMAALMVATSVADGFKSNATPK